MNKSRLFRRFVVGGLAVAASIFAVQFFVREPLNYSPEQRCLAMYRVRQLIENQKQTPPLQGDASLGLLDVQRACDGHVEQLGLLSSGISIGFIVAVDCANGKKVAVKYWDRGHEYGELMLAQPRDAQDVAQPFTQACRPNQ